MSEKNSPTVDESASQSRIKDLAERLYQGEAGLDVVGKRKIFYAVAAGILLIAILTALVRPFNFGIEFEGGNVFTVPSRVGTLEQVRSAFTDAGAHVATAQQIGNDSYQIKTAQFDEDEAVAAREATEAKEQVADEFGLQSSDISEEAISASWGGQITEGAVLGAAIFLVLVVVYLALVFREWRMAVAAMAALLQNLVLTAAVYLLVGFEVTPSTVIGFLTILGFALYDVVVVFDKVRENTRGITGSANRTYGEAANLAVNQTLMRSINTAVVALLPVGGILFIGAGLLGAGTLKDLGLVLFVGMLAAVYSSIFFATPVLVDLKEQEPRFKLHKQRVLQRRAAAANLERKAAVARTSTTDEDDEPQDTVSSGALAGASPRTGARPQQARKRPGAKPGSKSGRSGGRKR